MIARPFCTNYKENGAQSCILRGRVAAQNQGCTNMRLFCTIWPPPAFRASGPAILPYLGDWTLYEQSRTWPRGIHDCYMIATWRRSHFPEMANSVLKMHCCFGEHAPPRIGAEIFGREIPVNFRRVFKYQAPTAGSAQPSPTHFGFDEIRPL